MKESTNRAVYRVCGRARDTAMERSDKPREPEPVEHAYDVLPSTKDRRKRKFLGLMGRSGLHTGLKRSACVVLTIVLQDAKW